MVPFKVVYGHDPPPLLRHSSMEDTPYDIHKELCQQDQVLRTLKHNIQKAQVRMKHYANQKRSQVEFKAGDVVWVKLQPY